MGRVVTEVMQECLRVMKPGAHGLVWSLPRTSHWTATALEDAGFEVRDVVTHLFGQGFPKSLNISKAIDKAAGAERVVLGPDPYAKNHPNKSGSSVGQLYGEDSRGRGITAPSTNAAKQWQGFGTALKPAAEFWILIRKPLSEKTVAANVLKWGCGGLNIDGSKIGFASKEDKAAAAAAAAKRASKDQNNNRTGYGKFNKGPESIQPYLDQLDNGRFPSHLILDEEAAAALDEQSGTLKSGFRSEGVRKGLGYQGAKGDGGPAIGASAGGASRFFYCAKISPSERGKDNKHPTVKPQKLMSYLIKLVTPPGGVVLDAFMGSGSTGVAAKREGFRFIGIEQDPVYFAIAKERIAIDGNPANQLQMGGIL